MAFFENPVGSPWAGTLIKPFIQEAIASNGIFRVVPPTMHSGVKSKYMRGTSEVNMVIQPEAWELDLLSTASYNEVSKSICEYGCRIQLRNSTLNQTSLSLQLAQGVGAEQIQQTDLWTAQFMNMLAQLGRGFAQLGLLGTFNSTNGMYSFTSECDGLLTIANAEAQKYEGTLAFLNDPDPTATDNVYTELQAFIDTMLDVYMFGPDGAESRNADAGEGTTDPTRPPYIVCVHANVYRTLKEYYRRLGSAFDPSLRTGRPLYDVDGFTVRAVNDMPVDQALFISSEDLMLITDLDSDATNLEFINLMQSSPQRRGFEGRLDHRFGVDLAQPDRVVYGIWS